jgi:hypothetical protein
MFGAAGYDDAFAGIEGDDVVSEFDAEASLEDEEEFVFILMMVPGEFAQYFNEFDLLIVQPCDDFWPPVFAEQAEFFGKIDRGGHTERSGGTNILQGNRGVQPRWYAVEDWVTMVGTRIKFVGLALLSRPFCWIWLQFLLFRMRDCDDAFLSFAARVDVEALLGIETKF